MTFEHPIERWEPWTSVEAIVGQGPERVYDTNPAPETRVRPAGFVRERIEREPLLWDGDQA